MHYIGDDAHGLPFDPFKAIVAPRPIGWMSTLDSEGRTNLAPYSFFNAVASRPNLVAFSSEGFKHSIRNARDTGEFVFNLATRSLLEAMNQSSAPYDDGVSEFEATGLQAVPSKTVRPPRVAAAVAALECRLVHFMQLEDVDGRPLDRYLAIGQVLATYIDDAFITDGRFDAVAAGTLSRLGYRDFAQVSEVFELLRPSDPGA